MTVVEPGIIGKLNEFQAALGLLQLQKIDYAISKRKVLDGQYRDGLAGLRGITMLEVPRHTEHNFAYFPVLIEPDYPISRDELYMRLRQEGILARRYFYPLISDLPMYRGLESARASNLPGAQSVSRRILCLPIYPDLTQDEVAQVIDVIANESTR